ncbi:MAG: AI-2E family transporter [Melioribacter sp.]|nr:AI-2E family transporter [Melioribacter sp.]
MHPNFLYKKFLIPLILITFLICLIYIFTDIIVILIVSLLISMIFNPAVDYIEKKGFNRTVSVLFVFSLVGFLVVISMAYILPKIYNQMNSIAQIITPKNILSVFSGIEVMLKNLFPNIDTQNIFNQIYKELQNLLFGWFSNISSIIYSIFSLVTILIIIPFVTFFLLKDNKRIIRGIINLMPNKYFEVSYWVLKQISIQLARFVRGWILDASIVGILIGIGLYLLGINNAASIGFVAGVGHLIPYFGPIIGGLPAIIISVIQLGNFSMLPEIIILFAIIYTFDNGYVQPKVFSKSTDMHPLIIILLILIGGKLFGVLGMLLAVPAATVIKTAAKEIYYAYKNYKIIHM